MRRLSAVMGLTVAGLALLSATCVLRHESLTAIGEHDTFAGELHNDSGIDILHHKFQVTFLNSNLAIVETRTVDGCLRSLQDGSSDFFSVESTLPSATTKVALARMANSAEDPDFETGLTEPSDIAITDVVAERTGGTLTVTGTITNHDVDDLEDPAICAVVWNHDGRVVTTGKDETIADLAAGGTSDTFSVTLGVPNDAGLVDHVDIWADGLEGSVPVEPSVEKDVSIGVTPTPTASPTSTPTSTPTRTSTPTPTPTP